MEVQSFPESPQRKTIHILGEDENFSQSSFLDASPEVNFVWMLCSSCKLRLFPPVRKAELCVLFHVDGTFICEDDIVKLLVVFHALQAEL